MSTQPNKTVQVPKGMHDILPADYPYWERVGKVARELSEWYNFSRIQTPILEYAKLFEKGTGEGTDVVQKEMYTLKTRGGDTLALRPEGTPSVMRAYLEHSLSRISQPQRLMYNGPMFRHENPQHGRYRQFSQVGIEIIGGPNDPIYDAQTILFFQRFLEELKIKSTVLRMNSIGCRVCRPLYRKQLQNYYRPHEKELCIDCQRRLKTNPLRMLDCKNEKCQPFKEKAPNFLDKICSACSHHLKSVLEYLDELSIPYTMHNQLVRGLDYYNRTVFEFYVEGEGADVGALPGGGRYDYLSELLGARQVYAVGGAVGVDRVVDVMKLQQSKMPARLSKKVFVIHAGDLAKKKALKIIEVLREANIATSESLARESLKAQLKVADKEEASLAVILGQKEIYEDSAIVRDLRTGLQESFPTARLVDEVKKRLRA